ncbi:uncharacterized protein LOC110700816 [Chenopodium quinoa]|uniref:uncharacterized protein LOC110700816 n=1 Tax=Chenopodium quinoa TaxID=63459 RepID=UPI000B792D81|nr:uncharacterized protein LOC110700816 [Chenopodium quinoa]
MNYSIYRVDNWVNKIPVASYHPLRMVYNRSGGPHNRMLMQYIRYCYHHYFDKHQSSSFDHLDDELLALFPTAFSATYGELALRINSFPFTVPKSELLNHLHSVGLIYNRGNVRDRAAIREQRM